MFGLGIPEIVLILVVVSVALFIYWRKGKGVNKISDLSKGLGKFAGEFKKGKLEVEDGVEKTEKDSSGSKTKINKESK